MMIGMIIGRRRVRSPTSLPSALRAWRPRTSTSRAPSLMAWTRASATTWLASSMQLLGLGRVDPALGGDLRAPAQRFAVEVDGGDDHDDAFFGEQLAVAEHAVADVADGAVDVEVAGRDVAVAVEAVGVETDGVAVLAQQDLVVGNAHRPASAAWWTRWRYSPCTGTNVSGRATDSSVCSSPCRACPLTWTASAPEWMTFAPRR